MKPCTDCGTPLTPNEVERHEGACPLCAHRKIVTEAHESCPDCGHAVSVTYGPDYRFNPPCTRPRMWTACCSGQCLDDSKSWTGFTRERALELWDSGIRKLRQPA